ncbi:hypothetical protein [Candidatus Poriferisodalis sp.]
MADGYLIETEPGIPLPILANWPGGHDGVELPSPDLGIERDTQ